MSFLIFNADFNVFVVSFPNCFPMTDSGFSTREKVPPGCRLTLPGVRFYPERSLQVNRCDVAVFLVRSSDFFSGCAAASSVSLPAISGTKVGLRERCRGGSDTEEVRRLKGERAAAHMLIPLSSPPTNTHTHTAFFVPFSLSFLSLDSP